MNRNEARAALDAIENTDRRMAQRMRWPLWRHAAFGGVEAAFVYAIAQPPAVMAALIVVAIGALSWIIADDKARYGAFVSGWQGKKPKLVTIGIALAVVGLAIISLTRRDEPMPDSIVLLATLATFLVATAGSVLWERIYRAELRDGTAA